MDPGIYDGIDEMLYHADPALSHSGMKTLLDCPARYAWERENPPAPKDVFDLGSAVHAEVLGVGAPVARVDADDWRTKAAQQTRADLRAEGKIPLLHKDYDRVRGMTEAVLAHKGARIIAESTDAIEQSMWWHDDRFDVDLRGRVDLVASYADGMPVLVDLKTSTSANPDEFVKSVYRYGYDLQRAVYCDGWATLAGLVPDFLFIVVEKDPPYPVLTARVDDAAIRSGEAKFEQALCVFNDCRALGHWPAYGDDIVTLESPRWAS